MTKDLQEFDEAYAMALFLYGNTYVAITRWVDANRANPEMVTTFGDANGPALSAPEVVAVDQELHNHALMFLVVELGRILDRYLRSKVEPLIKIKPYDDSWYSLESVEALSSVTLADVFGYPEVLSLQIMLESIRNTGVFTASQILVLNMAKRVREFAEEFDARFKLAEETRRLYPKRHKAQKEAHNELQQKPADAGVSSADGSNSAPGGSLDRPRAEYPSSPRTSLGPSDGHPDSDHWNDGGPDPTDEDYRGDDDFDGTDEPNAS